jgi:hypothetical protein
MVSIADMVLPLELSARTVDRRDVSTTIPNARSHPARTHTQHRDPSDFGCRL